MSDANPTAVEPVTGRPPRAASPVRVAAVAGVVVALDQVTKTVAERDLGAAHHVAGPLWLRLDLNSGAAFSLGRGSTAVVEVVVVILVVSLVAFSGRAGRHGGVVAVGTGLLLGGALGNLTDRLVRHHTGAPGAVIDFIDAARIASHDWWPTFNLADAAIVMGAVALALGWRGDGARVGHHDRAGSHEGRRDGADGVGGGDGRSRPADGVGEP